MEGPVNYEEISFKTESITQPSHQAKLGNKVDIVIENYPKGGLKLE